jgi:ribosome-associated protein
MKRLTTEERLCIIVEAAESKKAENIEVLDLEGRSLMADYFVVCSGGSTLQIRGIVDGILDVLAQNGMKHPRIEGYAESKWVLVDAGDVVVHVFAKDEREFYDLESIWRGVEPALEAERAKPSEEANEPA